MDEIDELREARRGYPRATIIGAVNGAFASHGQGSRQSSVTAALIAAWLCDDTAVGDPPPLSSDLVRAIRHELISRLH